MNSRENLKSFYFGAIDESQRLKIEQSLLTDTETLLDYLDLKRELESAELVPQFPSWTLWQRLRQKAPARRTVWISMAVGLATAALITLFLLGRQLPVSTSPKTPTTAVLFDSSAERFASSSVF